MARQMLLLYCIITLVFNIARGDGHWKKAKLNQLKREVMLLEKIAGTLEHEIEELYDESYHTVRNKQAGRHKRKHTPNKHNPANITEHTNSALKPEPMRYLPPPSTAIPKLPNISSFHWPKFEEILSMNKRRYDWKNDRWIKLGDEVESKLKVKHKFNYRRVKINGGKSNGSVVIAVSAVR